MIFFNRKKMQQFLIRKNFREYSPLSEIFLYQAVKQQLCFIQRLLYGNF